MKFHKSDSEERAVSPVIGVILMVAITVILAAVIGTFVMGIGQDASKSAPQASFSVDLDVSNNNVSITHDGGDAVTDKDTRILIVNESSGNTITIDTGSSDTTFTVGQELVIATNGTQTTSGGHVSQESDVWTGRSAASTEYLIQSGNQYTVKLIDTNSQRTIFESTSTA